MSALALETPAELPSSKGPDVVFGRFMLPDMSEHACQVLDLGKESATFIASHAPREGVAIVAYLEGLGRVEVVADGLVPGGFRVRYTAQGSRLERLHQRIDWLQKKNAGTVEGRRHARFEPKERHSSITLPDGRVYTCEVIDISVSGAGVKTDVMPSIGTYLMLGKMKGRVVRYLENGVAIEFVKHLEKQQIGPSQADAS